MTEKEGLFYKDGHLYIPGYNDVKTLLIQENHDGPAGHMGFRKTLAKVAHSYYWQSMSKDFNQFVKTCDICQRIKSSTQKQLGTLNPIPPPATKFDTYSLDFIGPLPRTITGYDGILVIVDTFSKYVTLTPIEFQYGAKEVAQVIYT